MWYRVQNAETGAELRPPFETLGAAVAYCGDVTHCDTEIAGTDTGKVHAVFNAGLLVGGTPAAVDQARARGVEVATERG